jgi:hypothetical protein
MITTLLATTLPAAEPASIPTSVWDLLLIPSVFAIIAGAFWAYLALENALLDRRKMQEAVIEDSIKELETSRKEALAGLRRPKKKYLSMESFTSEEAAIEDAHAAAVAELREHARKLPLEGSRVPWALRAVALPVLLLVVGAVCLVFGCLPYVPAADSQRETAQTAWVQSYADWAQQTYGVSAGMDDLLESSETSGLRALFEDQPEHPKRSASVLVGDDVRQVTMIFVDDTPVLVESSGTRPVELERR